MYALQRQIAQLTPVGADAHLDGENDLQVARHLLHLRLQQLGELERPLCGVHHLVHQLVVHLQEQRGVQRPPADGLVHRHHRQFDDVGGAALDDRVHRLAAALRPKRRVVAGDVVNWPTTVADGLDVLPGGALAVHALLEHLNLPVALEEVLAKVNRLRLGDGEVLRQRLVADAVDDAVADL